MNSRWPEILMYHSIVRLASGPHALCVAPERFEAQMLYLKRRNLRGVSMRELRRAMSMGDTRGLVGLTFDDGYEDFLHNAVPVLERLGFSATVFVVAGMLGSKSRWQHVYEPDRKSTRLNSSHANISYAVFCLKKKNHTP